MTCIPNLIAQPFDISREDIDIVYDQTQSPRLEKVLKKWDEDDWGELQKPPETCVHHPR